MLEILPLKDKILQESICIQCSAKYDSSLMAYAAYSDGKPIGICQFSINNDVGTLVDLVINIDDTHPLFLLGLAVLNFMDLCGAYIVKCRNHNIDESTLISVGFSKKSDGSFEIDLYKNNN